MAPFRLRHKRSWGMLGVASLFSMALLVVINQTYMSLSTLGATPHWSPEVLLTTTSATGIDYNYSGQGLEREEPPQFSDRIVDSQKAVERNTIGRATNWSTTGIPHYRQRRRRPQVFVCITGVLSDLELANKVQTLLQPFQEALYEVKLALFLQNDTADARFVPFREPFFFLNSSSSKSKDHEILGQDHRERQNNSTISKLNPVIQHLFENPFGLRKRKGVIDDPYVLNMTLHRNREFTSEHDITSFLQLHGFVDETKNATSTSSQQQHPYHHNFRIHIYDPLVNPPMNLNYVKALLWHQHGSTGRVRMDAFGHIVWRAVNDLRMLENSYRCWSHWLLPGNASHPSSAEHEHNNTSQEDAAVPIVIRVGEDAMLTNKINAHNLVARFRHQQQHQNVEPSTSTDQTGSSRIVSLPCRTKRGHDKDQIDIFPFSTAEKYFTQPLIRFYNHDTHFHHNNMESPLSSYLKFIHKKLDDDTYTTTTPPTQPIPFSAPDLELAERSLIASNHMTTPKAISSRNRTVLICITGQLERLEMENKLKNLIQPLQNDGYDVELAFALSGGNAHFQAYKVPKGGLLPVFANESQLQTFLVRHNLSVISPNLTYAPNHDTVVNPQYLLQQGRTKSARQQKFRMSLMLKLQTVLDAMDQNMANAKMFTSYSRCWTNVQKTKKKYDLYIRVRDDVGFSFPQGPNELYADLTPKSLVTAAWRNNGGINDRMAIVGADVAECYFNLPHVKLYDGTYMTNCVINTETYFKDVYLRRKICSFAHVEKSGLIPQKILGGKLLDGHGQVQLYRQQQAKQTLLLNQTH